jgi:hypothetical protein
MRQVAGGLISLGMLLVIFRRHRLSVGSWWHSADAVRGHVRSVGIGPRSHCGASGAGQPDQRLVVARFKLQSFIVSRDDGYRARLRLLFTEIPFRRRTVSRLGATWSGHATEHDHARLLRARLVVPQPHTPAAAHGRDRGNEETLRLAGMTSGALWRRVHAFGRAVGALGPFSRAWGSGRASASPRLDAIALRDRRRRRSGAGSGGTLFGVLTLGLINNLLNVGVKASTRTS